MTTGKRLPAASPASAESKKACPVAHKFIVIPCFRGMKCGWDEHLPSIGSASWNRKHTACVHVGTVIDARTPTAKSAKDAIRSNGVSSATASRRLPGHRQGLWQRGEKQR